MRLPVTGALLACALMAATSAGGDDLRSQQVEAQTVVPGELLVRFRHTPENAGVKVLTSRLPLFAAAEEIRYDRVSDLWRLKFPELEATSAGLDRLSSDGGVAHVQPNYIYQRAEGPNDPLYPARQRPYLAAINLPAAWQENSNLTPVVVAVIDSGVDIDHPDLAGRIWGNSADPEDGIDNDGNGCTDDAHGCSFQSAPPNGNVSDLDGHGTFVSGIIAARRDNGVGIAGVASNATIMPVRALDAQGVGTTAQLVSSIQYAAESGADFINLSLALDPGDPNCPPDPLVEDALAVADDTYGVTILAATGNSANDCVAFPAASGHVIGVSASGPPERPDIRAFFSNYGPEVAVTAPGEGVVSTCPIPTASPTGFCPGTEYGSGGGTSFSTPIVVGVAALLLGQEPYLTNDAIRTRLMETAHDLPDDQHANWDGAGRVDAGRALGGGSVFAAVDVAVPEGEGIGLDLEAGTCRAGLWDGPVNPPEVLKQVLHRPSVSGAFGVGECAAFWPPTPGGTWRLVVQNRGRKAAVLNGWSLTSQGQTCGVASVPVVIPGGGTNWSDIACEPGNDGMEGATEVDISQLPLRLERDLRTATSSGDPVPSCLPPAPPNGVSFSRSVWYRMGASSISRGVAVDSFGSEIDKEPELQTFKTVLAVYRQGASGLEEVACNARSSPPGRIESRVVWRSEAGQTYYVMGAAYQSIPMGVLRLNFSPADLPANDESGAAAAIALSDAYPVVQPAHTATRAAADPPLSCVPLYGFSLWFRVAEPGGVPLTFTTANSDYNSVVGVFKRDAQGALTEVACDNNEGPGIVTSRVTWQSDGGEYFVVVGAFGLTSGGVLRGDLQSP